MTRKAAVQSRVLPGLFSQGDDASAAAAVDARDRSAAPTMPHTVRVWADTITYRSTRNCQGPRCRKPLWWARTVKNDRPISFHAPPVTLAMEEGPNRRAIAIVDASSVHFSQCVDAPSFRRDR